VGGRELQLELRRGRADLAADPVVVRDDLLVALVPRQARALELVLLEPAGRQLARCVDGVGLPDDLLMRRDLVAGRALVGEESGEASVLARQAGVLLVGPRRRLEVGVGRADHAAVVAALAVGEETVGHLARQPHDGIDEQRGRRQLDEHPPEPAQRSDEPDDLFPHGVYVSSQTMHQPLIMALWPVVPGQVLTRVNAII
jgi:hypothetical protein